MNLLFLLKSRKFWIALVTIISMLLASMGRNELPVEDVSNAIAIIVSVLIASIAAEDIGRQMSGDE